MTAARAFVAVDQTLRNLATEGLDDAGISPRPEVSIGPLDRADEGPRLNWFLYQVLPNAAFRNMEHPRDGAGTARGAPPLAVRLRYLLSAHGTEPVAGTDSEELVHAGLAAVMRRLHESPIVAAGSPFLPAPPPQLVEPLRITLDGFDLEDLSRLWSAASKPVRLSVAYSVSLVVVEQQRTHLLGPPVSERRVLTLAGPGPKLGVPEPERVGGDATTTVPVRGGAGAVFRMAAEDGDPAGAPPDGWPMVTVSEPPGGVELRLPRPDLAPGMRRLDVTVWTAGLPTGRDRVALTVVPTIRAAGALRTGTAATLTTAHCAPDTELFLDALPVPVSAVTPTSVAFTVPDAPGDHTLTLRSRQVTGDAVAVRVTT